MKMGKMEKMEENKLLEGNKKELPLEGVIRVTSVSLEGVLVTLVGPLGAVLQWGHGKNSRKLWGIKTWELQ